MSLISGLPAHALLLHFIVVLVPLTAIVAIMCAVWPAARQRLVWPVLTLAVGTAVLTPITANAGGWLEQQLAQHEEESAVLVAHTQLGETMVYFSLALLVAAVLLVVVHVRAGRATALPKALSAAIAVFVVVASVAATWQVYRIGETGAESVWGDALAAPTGEQTPGE